MMSFLSQFLSCIFFISILSPLSADEFFRAKNRKEIHISFVTSVDQIPQNEARKILVESLIKKYEDVPLNKPNPNFKCMGDVRGFYEDSFKDELAHFKHDEKLFLGPSPSRSSACWLGEF